MKYPRNQYRLSNNFQSFKVNLFLIIVSPTTDDACIYYLINRYIVTGLCLHLKTTRFGTISTDSSCTTLSASDIQNASSTWLAVGRTRTAAGYILLPTLRHRNEKYNNYTSINVENYL